MRLFVQRRCSHRCKSGSRCPISAPASRTPSYRNVFTHYEHDAANPYRKDRNTPIGTAALVNGVATFSTSALKTGNHSITAQYLGDNNVAASASAKLAYKIKQ
ncbi:MAG TPA: Ig-like domain-containing protein [Candidatus Solibacter sp.]|nr:Ig-like domain-containing protein [Candidatus Solibacter sp.]